MPVDLLIYIAIAVVLIIWLRNTLGTRTGSETDRSELLDRLKEQQEEIARAKAEAGNVIDGVVKPVDNPLNNNAPSTDPRDIVKELKLEGGADTAAEIVDFLRTFPAFNLREFLSGAREAFPMIVEAFARGDLATLKMLLSDNVYATFEQSIEDRKNKGETLVTDVLAVREVKILGLKRIGNMAYLKLRFLAEETIALRDREGNVIHGHPDKIIPMNDVWTFGRDMKSNNPTWYLYETSDDVVEDFKNPMPDSSI